MAVDTAALRARNVEFWSQTAPGWIRHADRHDNLSRPLGEPAMAWLRPRPGERVLDVGCGCGGTTAELAVAVAPGGEAVGLDLAPAMVEAARHRFPAARSPSPRFVAADIETTEVPGAPFDAAYSRMTLMLLADPVAGCATVRRALRAGGRLAATTFRDGASNPSLPLAVLGAAPHVGAMPPLPMGDEPGPFAFADPARVTRILAAAGFVDVEVRAHDEAMRAPDEPEAVAEWLIELGPASAAYRAATTTDQTAARVGTARLLERFREPGAGYAFPTGIWSITAIAG